MVSYRVLWFPIESYDFLSSPIVSYDFLCLPIADEGRKTPFTRPSHFRTPFPMLKAVTRFVIHFTPAI